jgi:hypothetical protein
MKKDEIIAMARQVGYPIQHPEWQKATEEFAALVAAKEREACAQVAFSWNHEITDLVAKEIRARGEQA